MSSAGVPILHIRHFASKITLLRIQKLLKLDFWAKFQTVPAPPRSSVHPPSGMTAEFRGSPSSPHTTEEDEDLFTVPSTDRKREHQGARPAGPSAHAKPRLLDARPAHSFPAQRLSQAHSEEACSAKTAFKSSLRSRSV